MSEKQEDTADSAGKSDVEEELLSVLIQSLERLSRTANMFGYLGELFMLVLEENRKAGHVDDRRIKRLLALGEQV